MALVQCPECLKDISESAVVCVHCGYPVKKYQKQNTMILKQCNIISKDEHKNKRKVIFLVAFILVVIVLSMVTFSHISKQAEIEKYRVEFSGEDEMREVLRSGNWHFTSFDGDYSREGYVTFEDTSINYYEQKPSISLTGTRCKLDYKNSSILTTSGVFCYDVIYYKGDYYLRQNPKEQEERWILFRLSEY